LDLFFLGNGAAGNKKRQYEQNFVFQKMN